MQLVSSAGIGMSLVKNSFISDRSPLPPRSRVSSQLIQEEPTSRGQICGKKSKISKNGKLSFEK